MNNQELSLVSEDKDEIVFQLNTESFGSLDLQLYIIHRNNGWNWVPFAGIRHWNAVYIRDKKFVVEAQLEELSKEIVQEINKSFYEFFRQLKNHRNYRLKLINLLNDEIREIWEIV